MTRYHPCGTPYCNKVFSLDACAVDQFHIITLVWTREIFAVKQIAHIAIAKTNIWLNARNVKKKNQMKSSFFHGNLSTMRKGEVSFFCCLKESRNSFARKFGRRIVLCYCEKREVNYYVCKKNKRASTL